MPRVAQELKFVTMKSVTIVRKQMNQGDKRRNRKQRRDIAKLEWLLRGRHLLAHVHVAVSDVFP
jgi:hypothetical protein